jgi:hypothetical protein
MGTTILRGGRGIDAASGTETVADMAVQVTLRQTPDVR